MRQLGLLGLLLAAATSPLSAQEERPAAPPEEDGKAGTGYAHTETSEDVLRFAVNFYKQSDGGGNPNLDEEMTVWEPLMLITKKLSERWSGHLKLQGDIISAASIEKRFPAGTQSGASGDKYLGFETGAFYAWSPRVKVGAGVSYAAEYDYHSLGGYLNGTYETPSKNDTFSARVGVFRDTLRLIRFDGWEEGDDTKQSTSFGLGWTRVLGPETVGTVSLDVTSQSGLMVTPYNSVVAAGTEVQEVLPDSRVRTAIHVRVRQLLLEDLAIEPGFGFYRDDWGATAFNVEAGVSWEVVPGSLILNPSYRYHTQTEVDYFVPVSAATIPEYRTQDSDVADFDSHTFGMRFVLPKVALFGTEQGLDFGFTYTMRSDDLDYFSLTFGNEWRF